MRGIFDRDPARRIYATVITRVRRKTKRPNIPRRERRIGTRSRMWTMMWSFSWNWERACLLRQVIFASYCANQGFKIRSSREDSCQFLNLSVLVTSCIFPPHLRGMVWPKNPIPPLPLSPRASPAYRLCLRAPRASPVSRLSRRGSSACARPRARVRLARMAGLRSDP